MPKKKKRFDPDKQKLKVQAKRLEKALHMMKKSSASVPAGHSKRTYVFWPEEVGANVPTHKDSNTKKNSEKFKVTKTKLVTNYQNDPSLTPEENRTSKHLYYATLRAEALKEVRESLTMSVALPGNHDPEGSTTIDLSKLTSAGAEE